MPTFAKRALYTSPVALALALIPLFAGAWTPSGLVATPGACGTGTINLDWNTVPYLGESIGGNGVTRYINANQTVSVSKTITVRNPLPVGTYSVVLGVWNAAYTYTDWHTIQTFNVTSGSNITSIPETASYTPTAADTYTLWFSLYPSSSNSDITSYQVDDNGAFLTDNVSTSSYSATGLAAGSSHTYTVHTVFSTEAVSPSSTPVTATAPSPCPFPDLTAGNTTPSPTPGVTGQSVSFSASASNIGSTTATNFPNVFQIANSDMTNTIALVSGGTIASLASGASAPLSGSYTFSTPGTYNIRACANMNTSGSMGVSETNTNNNCGAWQPMSVANPAPSCSALNVNDTDITAGQSVTLSWTCSNAASCSAVSNSDGFATGGSLSGSDGVTPSASSSSVTYGMTCGGSTFYFPTITVHSPNVTITASPNRINPGGSATISWTSSNTVSCSVTKNGAAWSSGVSNSGIVDSNITGQSTYLITCTTAGSSVTGSAVVNVNPRFQEF